MSSALKNLVLVTVLCLMCLAGTWLYFRNSSLAQPIKRAHDHAFLRGKFPLSIAYGSVAPTAFPDRHADLTNWPKLSPDVAVWIPVSLNLQGDLLVKDKTSGMKPLAEVIALFPGRRMVLSFLENRPDTAPRVLEIVDASKGEDRILIHSPIDRLVHELREQRPRWLFGTSAAVSTRLKMMSSIGLESAVPIDSDLLVIEQLPKRLAEISPAVVADAHRRNLRVIAGPVDTADEAKALFDLQVDGVMMTDLSGR
jgi:hypothetical protein